MFSLLRRYPAAIIFAVALLLRLAWIATLENNLAWIDEQEFASVAQHIAHGDGYVSTSFRANPILPYYLGAVFRLFGEQYAVARVGQAILGAVTCVIIYRVGLLLFAPAVGVLSGLLLAFYPPHIYLTGVFYVDCWLTFFCALALYLAALTLEARGALWLAFLCGVSLGLTTLTRAAFLTCLPCVALAWIYGGRWGWKRHALACATMALGCALVILPWTVRNYRVYGRPMLVSSGFYTMLWRGNNVLADGGADDRHLMWYNDLWRARLDRLPPEQRRAVQAEYDRIDRQVRERFAEVGDMYLTTDEVLKPIAIDALLSNPSRTAALMLRKVRTLFSAYSTTETNSLAARRNGIVAALSFYPILVFSLIGAWLALPRRRELALLYLIIVGTSASYVLLTVCTRFRVPIDPYLILFASFALVHFYPAVARGWQSSRSSGGAVRVGRDLGLADAHPTATLTHRSVETPASGKGRQAASRDAR